MVSRRLWPRDVRADRLAMARIERGKKIVSRSRSPWFVPMELLVGSLQETVACQKPPIGFARECHMRRRGLLTPHSAISPVVQRAADLFAVDAIAKSTAAARSPA